MCAGFDFHRKHGCFRNIQGVEHLNQSQRKNTPAVIRLPENRLIYMGPKGGTKQSYQNLG